MARNDSQLRVDGASEGTRLLFHLVDVHNRWLGIVGCTLTPTRYLHKHKTQNLFILNLIFYLIYYPASQHPLLNLKHYCK